MKLQIFVVVLTAISYGIAEDVKLGVFNGHQVITGEHKHLVKIVGESLCSGSIIDPTWVLTAGHCVYRIQMKQVFHHSQPTKQIAFIYGSYPHPQFQEHPTAETLDPNEINVDIALVKTSPIVFNQYIQPINLVKRTPKLNEMATIAGYGETNFGASNTEPLQGKVPVSTCPMEYKGTSVICTHGMVGSGRGDSGGPLTTVKGLAGVNSVTYCYFYWGISPCHSIAANVADKLTWINSVMASST